MLLDLEGGFFLPQFDEAISIERAEGVLAQEFAALSTV